MRGGNINVTVPYGWFTITDGAGTQYFFNQPQPGTGTHLTWVTGHCLTIPQYLLSRVQDRWGRAVNLTWSDVTVGAGTQKRVTAVKDDSGTGITLGYPNGDGLLRSVNDPQGRAHTIGYTAVPDETYPTPVNRQKLTSITVYGPGSPNRTVRTWSFVYSSDANTNNLAYAGTYTGDLVIQKTEPDGLVTNYRYEPIFLDPADHTRPRGQDWDGRVTQVSWMDGSEEGQTVQKVITRTLNSPTQATLSYPSSVDVPVTVQYNYSGIDLTSVVDQATGRTWSYTYDSYHNLQTVRSPQEQTGNPLVQYGYTTDSSGHITQRVATVLQDGGGSLGDPVTTLFNALNEPTQITASARSGGGNVDQVTQLTYDNGSPIVVGMSPGNLTKVLTGYGTSLQQETDLTYGGTPGAWGLPDTVKNAVGAISTFGYDNPSGRLLTSASPLNVLLPSANPDHPASVTTLQYNADGLPSLVQDPMGHQETIAYNAAASGSPNLVITVTHVGDGSYRSVTLDPMGRMVQSVDENGVTAKWTYNPEGQVKTIERAVGKPEDQTTVFNYDCRGDLYRIAPPSGAAGRVIFEYLRYNQDTTLDVSRGLYGTYEGQVTRINYPDGTNEYFGYNQAGELAWHRKQDGSIINISQRDALHRIKEIDYPANGSITGFSETTTYDEFGRVTAGVDNSGTTTAAYDVLNRVTALTPPSPQKALTYTYTPDTTNQRWTTTVNVAGIGNYAYPEDTKGRLAGVTNPFNRSFTPSYDLDGKVTSLLLGNGVQEQMQYTARDWLSSIQISKANTTSLDTFTYLYSTAYGAYDPTGHLWQEVDAGNRTHAFFYDNLYRLTQETHPDFGSYSYSYDANGNRTSKISTAGTDYYGVDLNNKLLWVNRGTNAAPTSGQTAPYTLFSYDADGRQTYRERRYDGGSLRELTFAWDSDDRLRSVNEGSTNRITAVYGGDGLRVSKVENWTGTAVTHNYSWGPDGLLYDSNQNTIYTPGFAQQANGVDRYLLPDWLGSSRYLSDSTGNSFPSALRYDAFGNRSATGGTDAYDPSDLQFAGASGYQTEYASATEPGLGLQYLDQRYYDSASGRFISQDTLRFLFDLNAYAYAFNDPTGLIDPLGLLSFEDVREFGYNNRFLIGAGAGLLTFAVSGNPYLAFEVGTFTGSALALQGGAGLGQTLGDGLLSGAMAYAAVPALALGATAVAYHLYETEEALSGFGGSFFWAPECDVSFDSLQGLANVEKGEVAEEAVSRAIGVSRNIGATAVPIPGSGPGGVRFPDFAPQVTLASRGTVVEVKDWPKIYMTPQIRDELDFALKHNGTLEIFTDAPAPTRGEMLREIRAGNISLTPLPPR